MTATPTLTTATAAPDPPHPIIDAGALGRLLARLIEQPGATFRPTARLGDDLGLDSLGRVELAAAVETELGLVIDDAALGPETTIAELAGLLAAAAPAAPPPALPGWPRTALAAAARDRLQVGLLFPLLRARCRLTIDGERHLAGLDGPALFAASHASHLDTPLVLAALPDHLRRRLAVAAAADYFFSRPWLGAAAGLLVNAFPFSRTGATRATLRACARLADAGWSLLLYPEGTRSTSGDLQPFRPGVGLLAVELWLPVVPVRLRGTAALLPKGARWPRPGAARVSFGPPLRFDDRTPPAGAARAIEAAVRAL